MPIVRTLKHSPSGFAMESPESGETSEYMSAGFLSDSDGDLFYRVLDSLWKMFPQNSSISPSEVDHFLVLFRNTEATFYVNELDFILTTIATRDVKAGERVTKADVAGISNLQFRNVEIPFGAGIGFYFSVGWRRGLYFDFQPNSSDPIVKSSSIERILGSCYERLHYPDFYDMDVKVRQTIVAMGWFPFFCFAQIGSAKFDRLIQRKKEGKPTELAENELMNVFDIDQLEVIKTRLLNTGSLERHKEFIDRSIEHYGRGDFLASTSILWPRIEGVFRLMFRDKKSKRVKPLLETLVDLLERQGTSPGMFFPALFAEYLLNFYLRDFDVATDDLPFSRHGLGHGVANAQDYDRKRALLGILMMDQLGFYLRELERHQLQEMP